MTTKLWKDSRPTFYEGLLLHMGEGVCVYYPIFFTRVEMGYDEVCVVLQQESRVPVIIMFSSVLILLPRPCMVNYCNEMILDGDGIYYVM